jgi:hypothetical protein
MVLVAGFVVVPAYASGAPGHSHQESPGHPGPTVAIAILLSLAGLAFLAVRRWGRRAAFLALALLVAWFGLESAVHSVHHFWDPQSAASCPLFLASHHVDGAAAPAIVTGTPTWTALPPPSLDEEQPRALQQFRSHEGRAPPALPSA